MSANAVVALAMLQHCEFRTAVAVQLVHHFQAAIEVAAALVAVMADGTPGDTSQGRRRLFPGSVGVQMLRRFHGVVQYATDNEQRGLKAVYEEVARPADDARPCGHMIATQPQVPRPNTCAEFGSRDAARSLWLRRHVAKRRDDQALIAQSCGLAELLVRPSKDVDDIYLGGVR